MKGFETRALEMHSSGMWQWSRVERAMDVMEETGMNALVFHQNDLADQLVFPSAYFDEELMWKRNPVRMHTIFNNRHYIAKVVAALKRRNMKFYAEVKELWFPDLLPEVHPEILREGGKYCAFHPFFWEFVRAKYEELFEVLPDIAGVVVSPGTRESRVSVSANACSCPECRGRTATEWYAKLLEAMYEPMRRRGKTLAVRDFSYSAGNQRNMIDAASSVSGDIVVSLKNTPHDFYPTFPDNPSIGNCGGHRQWVEFDAWGQFFGLGIFPCGVAEDLKERMRRCAAKGADGVIVRTDWEVITEASAFNSFNMLNLLAAGFLAEDPDADLDEVCRVWCARGLLSPMKSGSVHQEPVRPTAPDAWKRLGDFMRACWKVIEKSQYVRGHLFNEDDQYCNSVGRAFDMMVRIHGRDDWEPGASGAVAPTEANIAVILEEKRQAVREAERLPEVLGLDRIGVPEGFKREIEDLLGLFTLYVRGFEICARGVFRAEKYRTGRDDGDRREVETAVADLEAFEGEIAAALAEKDYPHHIPWLLDRKRIRELAADLKKHIGENAS